MGVKMNNKMGSGVPIAVVFLVFLSLLLIVTSLFYYNIKQNKLTDEIYEMKIFDEVNSQKLELTFYVQNIVDFAFENSGSREEFLVKMMERLAVYSVDGSYVLEELEQLEDQIVAENVPSFSASEVKMKLEFVLEEQIVENGEIMLEVSQKYKKEFSSSKI